MSPFWYAFTLTLLAGLSTGIGSLFGCCNRQPTIRFLSMALGFSAGVMTYVSLVSLLPYALHTLVGIYHDIFAEWLTLLLFFGGVLLTALIDMIVPESENPHQRIQDKHLLRMGLLTAGALAVHNFPEGIAAFLSALSMPEVAWPIVLAIAIHNIPEGIAVSVPVFYATRSRKKAVFYSFLSGLAEPVGGVIGYWLLASFITPAVLGGVFAMVAGIMVYIAFDELFPAAHRYSDRSAVIGLFAGMFLMGAILTVAD